MLDNSMSKNKGTVADGFIGRVMKTDAKAGEQRGEPDVRRAFVVEGRVLNGSNKGKDQLGKHDVILGRGLGTYNHVGNVEFRKLVNQHKMRYLASSKVDKPKVARELVQTWKQLDPPGRFLQRVEEENKLDWVEVCDKKAQEKASQCLRERTPDVLPYYEIVRDNKRKANKSADSVTDSNSPTQMKKKLRLDLMEFSGSTPEMPGMQTSNFNLSSMYTGDYPAVRAPGYSDVAELLLNQEIERKVALRQLLLQQLQSSQMNHQLSLETLLGLIPLQANALANPIHFGRWL